MCLLYFRANIINLTKTNRIYPVFHLPVSFDQAEIGDGDVEEENEDDETGVKLVSNE